MYHIRLDWIKCRQSIRKKFRQCQRIVEINRKRIDIFTIGAVVAVGYSDSHLKTTYAYYLQRQRQSLQETREKQKCLEDFSFYFFHFLIFFFPFLLYLFSCFVSSIPPPSPLLTAPSITFICIRYKRYSQVINFNTSASKVIFLTKSCKYIHREKLRGNSCCRNSFTLFFFSLIKFLIYITVPLSEVQQFLR